MEEVSSLELEAIWEKLRAELERPELIYIAKKLREDFHTICMEMKAQTLSLRKLFEEGREQWAERIPKLHVNMWEKVNVMANNLGLPLNVVLADLIVKALKKDPNELIEFSQRVP